MNKLLKMSLYDDYTHSEFLQFICALSFKNGVVKSEYICSHLKESFNIEVTKDLIDISIKNGLKNGVLVSNDDNYTEFHISKWRPYKIEDCRDYKNGNCQRGISCEFIHTEEERKNAKILKDSIYIHYCRNKTKYRKQENILHEHIFNLNKNREESEIIIKQQDYCIYNLNEYKKDYELKIDEIEEENRIIKKRKREIEEENRIIKKKQKQKENDIKYLDIKDIKDIYKRGYLDGIKKTMKEFSSSY